MTNFNPNAIYLVGLLTSGSELFIGNWLIGLFVGLLIVNVASLVHHLTKE